MASEAYKLSWIDVGSGNISRCWCLLRPKMVLRAVAWLAGWIFHDFLTPSSRSSYTAFFTFLKYVITEAPPAQLVGPALGSSRSILQLAGTGSLWQRATPGLSSHRTPLATKILLHKANTLVQAVFFFWKRCLLSPFSFLFCFLLSVDLWSVS